MFNKIAIYTSLMVAGLLHAIAGKAQVKVLSMQEAIQTGIDNYPAIKAKQSQIRSSRAYLSETKTEYLPDVNFSAQQDYGTINGQNGPLFGYKGLAVASSGPAQSVQNWNAAFGGLYLTNVNWDFFAFGRAVEKVRVQQRVLNRDTADYGQQVFQHKVRIAASYLTTLAAQRLVKVQQDNLNRTMEIRRVVVARVKNGLNPGVDSSFANAQVSNARIALTNAQQTEQEQVNQLSQYLGIAPTPSDYVLDSVFATKQPAMPDPQSRIGTEQHPILKYYQSRIKVSDEQARYQRTFAYPTFTLFGIFQGRGSGFEPLLTTGPIPYTSSYGRGVDPTRFNYLTGVAVVWNFTSLFRTHYQVRSQKLLSEQYRYDYDLTNQQLINQQILAETRIGNSVRNAKEAPVEIKAANEAFNQKTSLYRNGLGTITDYTEALFALNRAETDSYIAINNVWQALLFKAAATGDFGVFSSNY